MSAPEPERALPVTDAATKATEWLLGEGRRLSNGPAAFAGLCEHLRAAGVPVHRAWYGGLTLHPLVYAAGCTWRVGAGVTVNRRPHGFESTSMWRNSPAIPLLAGSPPIRCRRGRDPADFPVVAEMFAAGTTDYLAFALDVRGTLSVVVSFASHGPDGFSEAELAVLLAIRPALAAVLEIYAREEVAATVVATYLGADAGQRVLSGAIRRGDGETIRACVWFSDLRGFTQATEELPTAALLALLDDAFEAQAEAVAAAGGTVLKFMGDGLLAIFRASADDDGAAACRAAVVAARDLATRIPAIDARRGDTRVRYGLALHYGDVVFGNIGSRDRLDFTVIGAAVNRAARMEGLTQRLGQAVLLSAEVAARCGEAVESTGVHPLKGVATPVEVFALGTPVTR